ncbi:DUF4326 domain-containing protein [Clavibacter sepedonicus]|uniref:Uncharacterized protein n=1 Tax=Clavibacter sepedonicus TaxID=31964 RepID=B0RJA9_CLASE|nr:MULTISPECIES: DUF4326 domain-containing protein [Clavibacter]MBD5383132.1 DUF4326 domain-containing protein [Clavibacter sp.]OQJ45246.1 hypothetical protein B5P19_15385 [Clavibacter sepedonicus]OQJ50882.1 hypothetical protein B5P20_15720 [Clavibacter sepedonicus]UUK67317.1 DUF4326 domain-containing protein [Clavibacter sepedonicus]CAQ03299.1 hypothetical protein pCSL0056 [Clavibacter sepedonicus]
MSGQIDGADSGAAVASVPVGPRRLQLSRRRGARLPEGAVSVARPSQWGNGFRIGDTVRVGLIEATDDDSMVPVPDAATAVEFYRRWVSRRLHVQLQVRERLVGRDLACWCRADQPCHADVLLEIARTPVDEIWAGAR